ncbi:MmgE/PrpD family protein [Oceanicola granulosus HTCC2516]|uniref:MmgE/PrpD family protein n=1 Tax=Oceanicola granulosus (strain ATCC BAA-861 / DSM 15982 / KCTC 12143 / HTCC2516) TaxID=314256 RepID=Q2CJB7_OCEGH|nr:MmgE/PrpD family protein [Oceanicola granulosus]EAR52683.1 MmgE/PrpD family protein [Oceanicola granulosus HTCC2516]
MNHQSDTTVSDRLAEWIAGLSPDAIPEEARIAAEDTVLDTVALTIAALEMDYGRAAREAFATPGTCTVWGLEEGRESAAAALINGTCGHGEDYDNTFEGCPMHAGVVIVPALFAAGEALGLARRDVGKGIVVGSEVCNRLGLVAGKATHKAGFHPTAIMGTMGAAAGIAAAMNQTPQQIRDSLGVAASMAAGIIEYLADGSWTKRMHAGWAAQSGLKAAQMGAAGFRGPRSVFEGVHGLYAAFAPSIEPDFAPLLGDLGSRWEAARIAFKPYACGTMTQPFIDCAIRLKARGVRPEQIERMTCEVGEGTVHRLWEPLALKQSPPTAYAAKFSSPYTIAAGLIHGGAGLAEFTEEAVQDPEARALAAKVSYVINPDDEYPKNYTGHIRAELKDGTVVEERQPQLRGGVREPLSRDELRSKAAANLAFSGRRGEASGELAAFAAGIFASGERFDASPLARLGR